MHQSSNSPHLVLPNRGWTPVTLTAHHLTWRLRLPLIPVILLPPPDLGATITRMARCCSQDRHNEAPASRPVAEKSRSGLAALFSSWLWVWPLHLLCAGPLRVFSFAAPVSAMPALTEFEWSIPSAGVWPAAGYFGYFSKRGDNN